MSYPAWAKQANIRERRAVMELGWVKGLLENGGCESIEWAENREPNLEAVEVQSEPRDCNPDAPGARVPPPGGNQRER